MSEIATLSDGRLVENIVHFIRALRKAGVSIGTSQAKTAIEAVRLAGFTAKPDFYYTLRAALITRPEHLQIYHQVFTLFWRDPAYLDRMMQMMLPLLQTFETEEKARKPAERRAAEALTDQSKAPEGTEPQEELEVDARFSWSQNEILRQMDFEQMSNAESKEAEAAIKQLRLPVEPLVSRRTIASVHGHLPDTRAMLRRSLRKGGEIDRLSLKSKRTRPPNLVTLCDISGSMSVYSRMMMRFLHALVWSPNPGWGKVHGFTFGTQLTNITRALYLKDADLALGTIGQEAPDWQGGTRIGEALRQFNKEWSRRVLGQGAVVLLISDGLERGDVGLLAAEAGRLSRSCRRLIWLNPLLRWQAFEPKAAGIRAIMPHVDSFHACHSLDSLRELSQALSEPGEKQRLQAIL